MERRSFIKSSLLASSSLMIPGFLRSFQFLNESELSGYKTVVVIQFSGGNDGLNTIVPYDNDLYHKLRPSISKEHADILKLSDELGFNKALQPLRSIYDKGQMLILNNVGYPNPNRSHFRSMDIWQTASSSNEYKTTGWIGRFLDASCKNPYEALEADASLSLAMKGEQMNGMAVQDAKLLFQTTREPFFKEVVDNTDVSMLDEDNMGYLYKTMIDTSQSAEYIFDQSKIYKSQTEFPKGAFGRQMKNITELIISGIKTRVFYVSLGGFDTHVNQVQTQDRLLKSYAEGVEAMVKELKKNDRFDNTLLMTFSEFGRRVKQNGSGGTDHGTASNLFLMSGKLKKAGLYNSGPDLSNLDENGDIKFELDFRRIYAEVLQNWLKADADLILGQSFERLHVI